MFGFGGDCFNDDCTYEPYMGRMPEAILANTKFRLNTELSKTVFSKKLTRMSKG